MEEGEAYEQEEQQVFSQLGISLQLEGSLTEAGISEHHEEPQLERNWPSDACLEPLEGLSSMDLNLSSSLSSDSDPKWLETAKAIGTMCVFVVPLLLSSVGRP